MRKCYGQNITLGRARGISGTAGHVQRGGWFVGDQQLRLGSQRHGNHGALTQSVKKLVGETAALKLPAPAATLAASP
jgi:hypothetical protein